MSSRRALVVLILIGGLALAVPAGTDEAPAHGGSLAGGEAPAAAAGDDRVITPLQARKAVEAMAALGLLLYLLRRHRRPWTARRVGGSSGQAPTLSSFRW